MKGGFILFDGKFYPCNQPLFAGQDKHLLNTGIKESFRAENNEILFPWENYLHLQDYLAAMEFPVPKDWDLARLRKDVSRLLNKNHLFLASKISVHFYKEAENTHYLLTAEEIQRGFYPLNEPGFLLDFFEEGEKANSPFCSYEASSRYLWMSASSWAERKSKHNLLIPNSKGHLCEGIEATFGFFTDQSLIFPSRESLGFYPPLLKIIAQHAGESGIEVIFKTDISRDDLLNAEEVFLINNWMGIQKVLGLNNRRYYSTKTINLSLLLKEKAIQSTGIPNN